MDCSHARMLLLFDGPGPSEFTADVAASLQLHLGDCRQCRSLSERQHAADALLGSAMRQVPVPGDLEGRIHQKLTRHRRPNPWPWLAGAAVLLAAATLLGYAGYRHFHPPRPHFNYDLFLQMHAGASPESIVEAFRKKGVAMKVPAEPLPKYLDSWDIVSLQGKQVAKLTYVKQDHAGRVTAMAQVYVIPKDSFDDEFAPGVRSDMLKEEGGFFFLSIFTRGSREAFLE